MEMFILILLFIQKDELLPVQEMSVIVNPCIKLGHSRNMVLFVPEIFCYYSLYGEIKVRNVTS